jgi:cytochrome c peroxidase
MKTHHRFSEAAPRNAARPVSSPVRWAQGLAWAATLFALAVQAEEAGQPLMDTARQFFKPLPKDMASEEYPTSPGRVALGRKLFFDPRLSSDGTVSCQNCHRPALYATDALPKSIGAEHRLNARNAPTVLNAALQFKAHWIGDRADVEDQATKSLTGHASFGNPDAAAVIRKIKALGYEAEFAKVFPNEPEPVKPQNWGKAIGAYERTLVTPSPFDSYLKGDAQALDARAQQGLKTFMEIGCASCHNGVAVGGATFQKFGIFGDYWKETGSPSIDEGRFTETKAPADKYFFKVPSLRNVSMTPPFFHDGSVATLPQAVRIMGKLQLGKELTDRQVGDLVAFLNSLTGELPRDFAAEPVLGPQAFSPAPP